MKRHIAVFIKSAGFFGLWAAVVSLISVPIVNEPPFIAKNPAFLRLWWELFPLLAAAGITIFFVKIIERNKLSIGSFNSVIKNTITGIILGVLWIGITLFISGLIGSFKPGKFEYVPYLLVWIISAMINVIMQEYLVRGYLFFLIRREYNTITAVIITTLLFTLLHGGAFEAGIAAVLNVISMGIFMSALLIYTGNLIAPIAAHGIWNIIGSLIGCVSLADDYPVLIHCELTGAKIISGGEYKLEGSVIVLIINVINILVLIGLLISAGKKSMVKKSG
jgi:membrane protease YdiL (CAAX protease family)